MSCRLAVTMHSVGSFVRCPGRPALMALLLAFAKHLNRPGYLILDDVIVEKARAKRLPWAAPIYSFAKKHSVLGLPSGRAAVVFL
jgi:hypothetical protein